VRQPSGRGVVVSAWWRRGSPRRGQPCLSPLCADIAERLWQRHGEVLEAALLGPSPRGVVFESTDKVRSGEEATRVV